MATNHTESNGMSAAAQAAQLMFKKAELQHQQDQQKQQPVAIRSSRQPSKSSSVYSNYSVYKNPTAQKLSHSSSTHSKNPSISNSGSSRLSIGSNIASPPNRNSLFSTQTSTNPVVSPKLAASSTPSSSKKKKGAVKQTWNQVNANSSQAALAAASLIAKQNPNKMGPTDSFNKDTHSPNNNSQIASQPHYVSPSASTLPVQVGFKKSVFGETDPSSRYLDSNNLLNANIESSNNLIGISPTQNYVSSYAGDAKSLTRPSYDINSINEFRTPQTAKREAMTNGSIDASPTNSTTSLRSHTISEDEELMPLDIASLGASGSESIETPIQHSGKPLNKFNYEIPNFVDSKRPSNNDMNVSSTLLHPYYNLYKRPSSSDRHLSDSFRNLTVNAPSIEVTSSPEMKPKSELTGSSPSISNTTSSPRLLPRNSETLAKSPSIQPSRTSVSIFKRKPPPLAALSVESSPELLSTSHFNDSDLSLDLQGPFANRTFPKVSETHIYSDGEYSSMIPTPQEDFPEFIERPGTLLSGSIPNNSYRTSNLNFDSSSASVNKLSTSDVAGQAALLASKQQQKKQQDQLYHQQQQLEQQHQQYLQQQMARSSSFDAAEASHSGTSTPYYPLSHPETVKLPHHHHGPLRGKHSKQIKKIFGMKDESSASINDFDNYSSTQLGHSSSMGVNANSVPLVPNQSSQQYQPNTQKLKFKTTMRKEKHTKSQFNEAKPWKHHTTSTTVTEEEKKRYEGVWASNKGLHMNYDNNLTIGYTDSTECLEGQENLDGKDQIFEDDYEEDEVDDDEDEVNEIDAEEDEGEEGFAEDDAEDDTEAFDSPEEDHAEDFPQGLDSEEGTVVPSVMTAGKDKSTEDAQKTIRGFTYQMLNMNLKDCIHGLVVREIWKRSRLPDDTLEKIWSLLIHHRAEQYIKKAKFRGITVSETSDTDFDIGILDKKEFILGMWYVDQCLYGKKLPKSITEEVSDSVEERATIKVSGISAKKKSKRHKKMMRSVGRRRKSNKSS